MGSRGTRPNNINTGQYFTLSGSSKFLFIKWGKQYAFTSTSLLETYKKKKKGKTKNKKKTIQLQPSSCQSLTISALKMPQQHLNHLSEGFLGTQWK